MGSFGVGFLQAVGDAAQDKLKKVQADDEAQKEALRQIDWQALTSGKLDDKTRQEVYNRLMKTYGHSKPAKELMGKIGHLIHGIHGHDEAMNRDTTATAAPPTVAPPSGESVPLTTTPTQQLSPQTSSKMLQGWGAMPPPPTPPQSMDSQILSAAFPNPEDAAKQAFSAEKQKLDLQHQYKMEELALQGKNKARTPAYKFDYQTTNGDRLPETAVDMDGNHIGPEGRLSSLSWQAVGRDDAGHPMYNPVNPSLRFQVVGNHLLAIGAKDGVPVGWVSKDPIRNATANQHYDAGSGRVISTFTTPMSGTVSDYPIIGGKMPPGLEPTPDALTVDPQGNPIEEKSTKPIPHVQSDTTAIVNKAKTGGTIPSPPKKDKETGQSFVLDETGHIPTSIIGKKDIPGLPEPVTPQMLEGANNLIDNIPPDSISDRVREPAIRIAAAFGHKYQPPLIPQAQDLVFKTKAVQDQTTELMHRIEELGLQENNQSGYLFFPRVGYALGHASPENDLGSDIAKFSLGQVTESASAIQGTSRSLAALQKAMIHTGDVWKDSPKMLYHKLQIINERLSDMIRDAQEYGVKGGGRVPIKLNPPPKNAPPASKLTKGKITYFKSRPGEGWTLDENNQPKQVNVR